jgi:electron transfer flavoprotein beta subunit
MNIVAIIKIVPDLVEELTVDESGAALDKEWLRLIINEFDDHSVEQAILVKEKSGGQVTVIAPDLEGIDDVLFAAAARGADRIIKLTGAFEEGVNNHALARACATVAKDLQPDLILTGVQAHDDLDGPVGPLVAEYLGLPYVGYVAGASVTNGSLSIRKEYPGGLMAELDVVLPAVLGIQAAEQPPRYVAISKIRQVMKTAVIEEHPVDDLDGSGGPVIDRLYQPEVGERATILEGDEDEIAAKIIEILQDEGLL